MFHIPQSRTEVIKYGIKILHSQERHFRTLSVQHYKLYALAFFTLEAAIAILVVFIAYPVGNGEFFEEAMAVVKESIASLDTIKDLNTFAHPTKELIELLMLRAEKLHKNTSANTSVTSSLQIPTLQDSTPPQYINLECKQSSWENESFNFPKYCPYPNQSLEQAHSNTSFIPAHSTFDLTCGGITGNLALLLQSSIMFTIRCRIRGFR